MDSFNELLFRRIVESITVNEIYKYKVTFNFKVRIERTVDMTDKEKNRFERKIPFINLKGFFMESKDQ